MIYKNIGSVIIEIDLNPNFIILAIADYNKESKDYSASYWIRSKDTTMLDLCQNFENITIQGDLKTIRKNILEDIRTKYYNGEFEYYINRYKFEQQCFDIGCNCLEQ